MAEAAKTLDLLRHRPNEVSGGDGEEGGVVEEPKKRARHSSASAWLRERRVRELVRDKRRLVEVPYTATLADTVNVLAANNVVAAPVAAPPGHWIGAGGSMILESDRATGVVRKHYIGMVTVLDILVHIAEEDAGSLDGDVSIDVERKMSVPVSSIIGLSLEGLSLWTLNPNTSILDCMETFSKGVHRALVPLESQADNVIAVELVEASYGYRMLTQTDVLHFLKAHSEELRDIISCSAGQLGVINNNVFAVTRHTKVIEAMKAMRSASLSAVPIVEDLDAAVSNEVLQDGTGKRLMSTFSATDLRSCPMDLLQSCLSISIMEFRERLSTRIAHNFDKAAAMLSPQQVISCHRSTNLVDVIEKAAEWRVHRVWVTDQQGLLEGVISLSDILGVVREGVISEGLKAHVELSSYPEE